MLTSRSGASNLDRGRPGEGPRRHMVPLNASGVSGMRKLLLSLACMLFMAGLVIAAEYTIVSYDKDKKVLTVTDKDGKEVTGKLTDATKAYRIDKDGNKVDGKVEGIE